MAQMSRAASMLQIVDGSEGVGGTHLIVVQDEVVELDRYEKY